MNKSIKVKFMILLSCIIFFPSVSFAHCDGDDNGNCTGILVIGFALARHPSEEGL